MLPFLREIQKKNLPRDDEASMNGRNGFQKTGSLWEIKKIIFGRWVIPVLVVLVPKYIMMPDQMQITMDILGE